VIRSATTRQEQTASHISVCSQLLTDEHGFDGFTMDDLAEASGVSRRTLFNYFPGKADAVLGQVRGFPPDLLDEFRNGGPHHNLVKDLGVLAYTTLSAKDVQRESVARYRRILRNNPKLQAAAHERLAAISESMVAEIIEREGPSFDAQRGRIAVHVLMALLDASLDAFLADRNERELADLFMDILNTAHELLS
jgi:AcrR family transcriptional regulator